MSELNGDHRFEFFRKSVNQTLASVGVRKLSALQAVQAALAKERQRLITERPKIFLGVPAYSLTGMHDKAWAGFVISPTDGENLEVVQSKFTNSLLARSFNHLWAQALVQRERSGVTHFAMLHTDVAPTEQFWLDKLWEEMQRVQADLISVVIPIKSPLGLTSLAVDNPDDPWTVRRLTMTEVVEQLPETFDNEAVIDAGLNPKQSLLLHNTGCWMCDLRRPWVDAVDEQGNLRCYFTIRDQVRRQKDGTYFVGVQPEDWNFSRMVQTVDPKARLFATRKIPVEHMGETGFPNWKSWGQWKTDEEAAALTKSSEQPSSEIPTAEAVEEAEPVLA